jgi:hypothetical protein
MTTEPLSQDRSQGLGTENSQKDRCNNDAILTFPTPLPLRRRHHPHRRRPRLHRR